MPKTGGKILEVIHRMRVISAKYVFGKIKHFMPIIAQESYLNYYITKILIELQLIGLTHG